MANLTDHFKTDLIDDITADLYNNLLASSLHAGLVNVEAVTADKTLTNNDFALQVLTTDAVRVVSLPAVGASNHPFYIVNASTSFVLTVQNAGGATIQTVGASSASVFVSDGIAWYSLSAPEATATAKGTLQLAGQLGGTAALPDVRGLRETGGPTLLALGAVGDGQTLKRVGTNLVGTESYPAPTAPGAGLLSVLGIGNGETVRADKPLFDNSTPSMVNYLAGSPGTSLLAARRDHVHNQAPTLRLASDSVVISGGVITVNASVITLDTEGAAATDDLDTINGGFVGEIIILKTALSTRDVTVKDTTGNLRLAGDCVLGTFNDTIMLLNRGSNIWIEVARSING